MSTRYKHLFFDLDHTLWDFHTNSRETLIMLYDQHNLDEKLGCDHDEFYHRYIDVNDSKWILYRQGAITKEQLRSQRFYETFKSLGLDDREFSLRFDHEYIEICPTRTALVPGTIELLDHLKDNYELHIITNGFANTQDVKLSTSGIKDYFINVFASENIGVHKPDARIFVQSLKNAGATRRESLMIGDNLAADIIGARNCGIDQVYFNPSRVPHNERPTFEVSELIEMKTFL